MANISAQDIAIIKESTNKLRGQSAQIVAKLYYYFFQEHSELKTYFSTCFLGNNVFDGTKDHVTLMSKTMAHVYFQFALNIDRLAKLETDMERVSYKHVSRGIKPDFYPFLGDALLRALHDVLGDDAKVLAAWQHAFDVISNKLIENEKRITAELKSQENSWEGFRQFKVVSTKIEQVDGGFDSDEDDANDGAVVEHTKVNRYCYVLEARDGNKNLPKLTVGQYVCIRFGIDGNISHRNYDVEEIHDNQLVLAIKCDRADPSAASGFIRKNWTRGSLVDISAPMGSFLLLESLSLT